MEQKKAAINQLSPDVEQAEMEVNSNQTEARRTQTQVTRLTNDIGRMNLELTELKNFEEPVPQDVALLVRMHCLKLVANDSEISSCLSVHV